MASRREQTVQRILDGAAAVFAKGGFAAASMEEIAASAGVSKLLLYRDFTGKRELYQAVLERTQQRIRERVPHAATLESLDALMAAARADPDGFVLLFRQAAREPEFAWYADAIATEWAAGSQRLIHAYEHDPVMLRWASRTAVEATYHMIILWLEHGDPARDAEAVARIGRAARAVVTEPAPDRDGPRQTDER